MEISSKTRGGRRVIHQAIEQLISYTTFKELITVEDQIYLYNQLCSLLNIEGQKPSFHEVPLDKSIDDYLTPILDFAVQEHMIEVDTTLNRDLFEDKIMNHFLPRPGDLTKQFYHTMFSDPELATSTYYKLAKESNYIKTSRIAKNIHYLAENKYGQVEITINLSKPEKDPRDIAKAKQDTHNYPSCLLCKEHVGHEGDASLPPRMTHRIIPLTLNEERFYLQYSPYSYYQEHCIVLHEDHIPMNVGQHTFQRLLDFVEQFPHYFLGSNAGLPIVGGSILSHEHYQGGRAHFPIEDAHVLKEFTQGNVSYQVLHWPLSTIRLRSKSKTELIHASEHMRQRWISYENKDLHIYKHTDTPHNAVTPVARKIGMEFIIDLTLRNNLTTSDHPMGLFHPHEEHHHIKKENIGLIEVMGLAILPGRLLEELEEIKEAIVQKKDYPTNKLHSHWVKELKDKYVDQDIDVFIRQEVAIKFTKVLENSGVFKQDKEGQQAFLSFVEDAIYDY